jgi:hypothetical protein
MFKVTTELVNDREHCTIPVKAEKPIVKKVEITVDAGSIQADIDGLSVLVTMLNGSVSVAVVEGEEVVEVYGKNRQQAG